MDWMGRNADRRGDPHAIWPDGRSIVMLGINYGPDENPLLVLQRRMRGAISVYAQGDDYHEVVKPRLKNSGVGSSTTPAARSRSLSIRRR